MDTIITILVAVVVLGFIYKTFVHKAKDKKSTVGGGVSSGGTYGSSSSDDNQKFQI